VSRIHAYRNLTRNCWSVRRDGRVVAYVSAIALQSCVLRVREGGRLRVLCEGHRNVHAWIEGVPVDDVRAADLVEIGYNPFLAPTFTIRPGFDPVHSADLVILGADGRAWVAL
jgi:ribosomal protein L36